MPAKTPFRFLATTALTLVLTTTVNAQYAGPTGDKPGYVGPDGEHASPKVSAILDKPKDDQNVRLQGTLVRKVGREKYAFSDGSGEIVVEIDDDKFPRQRIDDKTKVEITGEVDTGLTRPPEIEVESMRVLQ